MKIGEKIEEFWNWLLYDFEKEYPLLSIPIILIGIILNIILVVISIPFAVIKEIIKLASKLTTK